MRFLSQFKEGTINKFSPFSKYPACYKDVSFWVKDVNDFEENDFYEIVREIGGDLIEQVTCVDTFVNKKTGLTSKCYRINYRSLERTLTNPEVTSKLCSQSLTTIKELKPILYTQIDAL